MRSAPTRTSTFLVLSLFLLIPLAASAECSDHEMTAVMIVGQDSPAFPANYQTLETLSVYAVGEHTYPSYDELRSIMADYVDCDFVFLGPYEGQYIQITCEPGVSESYGIFDYRTGQMPFLGTASETGVGQVLVPAEPTDGWSMVEGDPAAEPTQIDLFRESELFPIISMEAFQDQVMAALLQTDVLHSFAECGDYSVTIFPYTPTVNPVDPMVAKAVVMVNGSCGEPWNDKPVAVVSRTWGSVKSLYR